MCKMSLDGKTILMDCATCPFELTSKDCIRSFFGRLEALVDRPIEGARYEEEVVITLDREETRILTEYAGVCMLFEQKMMDEGTFGSKDDDFFGKRKTLFQSVYKNLTDDILLGVKMLEEYDEPPTMRSIYLAGRERFFATKEELTKKIKESSFYRLVEKARTPRRAYATLLGLRTNEITDSILLSLPPDAKEIPGSRYVLDYGVEVRVYEREKSEARLYVQTDPLESLREELRALVREELNRAYADAIPKETIYLETLYETKLSEYKQTLAKLAQQQGIAIDPSTAFLMAREIVNWAFGLGSPIENICLDRKNITDIYIDAENAPLYVEHLQYGMCHTLFRYNRKMMERAIRNIILTSAQHRKFDEKNPIADIVLTRLTMRCHLQGPPATFGELQLALRIMKETPFTYAQYLAHQSFTPFFAGYDDVMVSLGCSEGVLGLKGVGKTSFTGAKIAAIGTSKRILPIQDIEEIPVKAYRKRGFHIGAMRVQSSDIEVESGTELSLIAMANASLRMGDSCLIINELRSRTAIQGLINLLNTQPGVFVLYNLHAESLKAVQDRFELVFGIPSAAMFATDRYTFLKKVTFGRKGPIRRMLGQSFESDLSKQQYAEVFRLERGTNIDTSMLKCLFLKNPEASSWKLTSLVKELDLVFIPPALERRCEERGIAVEQALLQAFVKGKTYYLLYDASVKAGMPSLTEIDFVLRVNTELNRLLKAQENEHGHVDFASFDREWEERLKEMIKEEIRRGGTQEPPPAPQINEQGEQETDENDVIISLPRNYTIKPVRR